MNLYSKTSAFALIVIMSISSLNTVQFAFAAAPIPSVPEFTAELVDRSYDVPETSSINQYTGEIIVTPTHRVQNYTIELRIKNQPIAPATVGGISGWNAELRYDVNVKGHFAQNWTIMYLHFEGPKPSNSDYTTITYELASSPTHPEQGFQLRSFFDDPVGSNTIEEIPCNSRLDFRVRAMYGAMHRTVNPEATDPLSMYPWVFEGEISNWSSTQTITIPNSGMAPTPNSSADASQNPTATPLQPGTQTTAEQSGWDWAGVGLFAALGVIVVLLLVIVFIQRRNKKAANAMGLIF